MRIRLSFGHRASDRVQHTVKLLPGAPGVTVSAPVAVEFEADDRLDDSSTIHVGAGDVDTLECDLVWIPSKSPRRNPHELWTHLIQNSTLEVAGRLRDDPGLDPGAPVLTVQLAHDSTRGFSIGLDQLRRHRAMWLPEHDAYVTLADAPVGFATHLASLTGERVLDRVKREPEASLAAFTSRWEDMGNPEAWNKSWETKWLGTRGHLITTVGQHGSLYKFAIDRYASVRPDFASPHRFRFDLHWSGATWEEQRLTNGLPVIVTRFSRAGQECEIEQFAAPRDAGNPSSRGEQPMVLFTRATLTGTDGPVELGVRLASQSSNQQVELEKVDGLWCVVDRSTRDIWLTIEPGAGLAVEPGAIVADASDPRVEFAIVGTPVAGQSGEVVFKLPAPVAPADAGAMLAALDFSAEHASTLAYWHNWLSQGARFDVPEPRVNELFRSNLWHALRLPRFRTEQGQPRIDLPYSNLAYGQLNADWPINQAVYVDYMLYGLRGHFDVAEDEFAAMFQTQQQADGRIGGFANWGVYTPAMLYSIGQNFLLSRDRESLERLLPQSLEAMNWCLRQVSAVQENSQGPGLILLPLNDLTHEERAWAFPQAYFAAGLEVFARALAAYGHPRAEECRTASESMRQTIEREFARGSVKSPVVPLADGTWINYVPCDAMTPRRLLDAWYPTDVDTGPLHLPRLNAIDPRGWLATAMLHDHEDNLFLNQWGAANEPVYNPQGVTYLLRDEPEAAIRTFYSTMACAFSHSQGEPVEHRWAWPQYFGPPSTDGAWFELFRKLLIHERDDGTLLLGQATPRAWLEQGKQIVVERAPTYFGPISFQIESQASDHRLRATVAFGSDRRPETLLVRLRHPTRRPFRSIMVNGENWSDFDSREEWVRIPEPRLGRYDIVAEH